MKSGRHKRTNIVRFRLYEVPIIVKFVELERRTVVIRGWGKGRIGNCYLMGTEFQFGMMKKSWRWMMGMFAMRM